MSLLKAAIEHIVFARNYSLRLIGAVDERDWFRTPDGITHVAWQVGHLAMAEYRMALQRIRGDRPEDEQLISSPFLKTFGRDSVITADAAQYPTPDELRRILGAVHEQTLRELKDLPEDQWQQPPERPHPLAATKLQCLYWCSHHEMIHAGQIGLLRRLLGAKPLW